MTAPAGDLAARVLAYAGQPARPPYAARYPVNEAMIDHWTDAMGGGRPASTGAAPPAMLAAWTMPGLNPVPLAEGPLDELIRDLLANGFTGVVATNLTQEYDRTLQVGEMVTATPRIETVAGPKQTALGTGFFMDVETTFTVASGERVGISTLRILRYRPGPRVTGRRRRPVIDQDSRFFWDGVAAGELRIQRCAACGVLRHPPRPMCSVCRSLEWDWVTASGRGTVYSFVVHHAPAVPGMATPFVVALVELEEGTRLVANLTGVPTTEVRVGMPVEVSFGDAGDGLVLPFWRPRI